MLRRMHATDVFKISLNCSISVRCIVLCMHGPHEEAKVAFNVHHVLTTTVSHLGNFDLLSINQKTHMINNRFHIFR